MREEQELDENKCADETHEHPEGPLGAGEERCSDENCGHGLHAKERRVSRGGALLLRRENVQCVNEQRTQVS